MRLPDISAPLVEDVVFSQGWVYNLCLYNPIKNQMTIGTILPRNLILTLYLPKRSILSAPKISMLYPKYLEGTMRGTVQDVDSGTDFPEGPQVYRKQGQQSTSWQA